MNRIRNSRWMTALVILFAISIIVSVIHYCEAQKAQSAHVNASPTSQMATAPSPATGSTATADPESSRLKSFDWSSLKGQKLSNAYRMLSYKGIDTSALNITVITSDGRMVINTANWTVTDISYTAPDRVLIHVSHDTATSGRGIIGTLNSLVGEARSAI